MTFSQKKQLRMALIVMCFCFSAFRLMGFSVFVESVPSGAKVTVNGVALPGVTPVLFRGEAPGHYEFVIEAPGFEAAVVSMELDPQTVVRVQEELLPDYILLGFPEDASRLLQQAEIDTATYVRLPQGTYMFSRSQGYVDVTPLYPAESFLSGLNIAVPVAVIATVASFVADVYAPRAEGDLVSPLTIGYLVATAGLIVLDVALYFDRARYYENYEPIVLNRSPSEAEVLLEAATQSLEVGELEDAFDHLTMLLRDFPNAVEAPDVLYRRARVQLALGDVNEAIADFSAVMTDYPAANVYDRAVLALAETLLQAGQPREALATLELVTHVLDSPGREEVGVLRATILDDAVEKDANLAAMRVNSWKKLIEEYPGSDNGDLYQVRLAGALLAVGRTDEALELLQQLESNEPSDILSVEIRRLRDRFITSE